MVSGKIFTTNPVTTTTTLSVQIRYNNIYTFFRGFYTKSDIFNCGSLSGVFKGFNKPINKHINKHKSDRLHWGRLSGVFGGFDYV